jgi:hypothetical protein
MSMWTAWQVKVFQIQFVSSVLTFDDFIIFKLDVELEGFRIKSQFLSTSN